MSNNTEAEHEKSDLRNYRSPKIEVVSYNYSHDAVINNNESIKLVSAAFLDDLSLIDEFQKSFHNNENIRKLDGENENILSQILMVRSSNGYQLEWSFHSDKKNYEWDLFWDTSDKIVFMKLLYVEDYVQLNNFMSEILLESTSLSSQLEKSNRNISSTQVTVTSRYSKLRLVLLTETGTIHLYDPITLVPLPLSPSTDWSFSGLFFDDTMLRGLASRAIWDSFIFRLELGVKVSLFNEDTKSYYFIDNHLCVFARKKEHHVCIHVGAFSQMLIFESIRVVQNKNLDMNESWRREVEAQSIYEDLIENPSSNVNKMHSLVFVEYSPEILNQEICINLAPCVHTNYSILEYIKGLIPPIRTLFLHFDEDNEIINTLSYRDDDSDLYQVMFLFACKMFKKCHIKAKKWMDNTVFQCNFSVYNYTDVETASNFEVHNLVYTVFVLSGVEASVNHLEKPLNSNFCHILENYLLQRLEDGSCENNNSHLLQALLVLEPVPSSLLSLVHYPSYLSIIADPSVGVSHSDYRSSLLSEIICLTDLFSTWSFRTRLQVSGHLLHFHHILEYIRKIVADNCSNDGNIGDGTTTDSDNESRHHGTIMNKRTKFTWLITLLDNCYESSTSVREVSNLQESFQLSRMKQPLLLFEVCLAILRLVYLEEAIDLSTEKVYNLLIYNVHILLEKCAEYFTPRTCYDVTFVKYNKTCPIHFTEQHYLDIQECIKTVTKLVGVAAASSSDGCSIFVSELIFLTGLLISGQNGYICVLASLLLYFSKDDQSLSVERAFERVSEGDVYIAPDTLRSCLLEDYKIMNRVKYLDQHCQTEDQTKLLAKMMPKHLTILSRQTKIKIVKFLLFHDAADQSLADLLNLDNDAVMKNKNKNYDEGEEVNEKARYHHSPVEVGMSDMLKLCEETLGCVDTLPRHILEDISKI